MAVAARLRRSHSQRGKSSRLQLADQSFRWSDQIQRRRLVPRGHEWGWPPFKLEGKRLEHPTGNHREFLCAKSPGLLGCTGSHESRLEDRLLRLGWPA